MIERSVSVDYKYRPHRVYQRAFLLVAVGLALGALIAALIPDW